MTMAYFLTMGKNGLADVLSLEKWRKERNKDNSYFGEAVVEGMLISEIHKQIEGQEI